MKFCGKCWPDTEGDFCCILLGRLAERVNDIAALLPLREHLACDGKVISLWGNVQHWSVVRDLLCGTWYSSNNPIFQEVHHRLFSVNEILDLFRFLRYERVRADYLVQHGDETYLKKLQAFSGIKNRLLLETTFWCMEARPFNEEITSLRGQLTPELRKEFARILRRIEHGIEEEANCSLAQAFCKGQEISEEYLRAFVRSVTMQPRQVLEKLQEHIHE